MKITLEAGSLAEAVAWTAHALPRRATTPVLAGIRLDATGGSLRMSAFDYETSRTVDVEAEIADDGLVVLPGRLLADVAKVLPVKQRVELVADGQAVTLTCGSTEFELRTLPAEDYPKLPEIPPTVGQVDGQAFAEAVNLAARAASTDDATPTLTGIRVDGDGSVLTFAATDRYRLTSRAVAWDGGELGVLFPAQTLADVVKGLPAGPATVHLSADGGLAAVSGGGRTTTVRLLDPEWIDYACRLGTDSYTTWATIDNVTDVTAAIRRVSLVAERSAPVRLKFAGRQMVVSAGGGEMGRGREVVDCVTLDDGDPIEIAFQPQYILDGLASVPYSRCRIGMTSPATPAIIVEPGIDPKLRYLVMPIREA
ncbi:DNA polymerase III subunit beta [Planomonospora sp. ID67723]|uniref:DNA polymerase III subunit beta n=1 Tax=Planomonospora sp. ID67723 TaxID=2738134 RepID=UPI0018C3FD7F|nr:DNA polymerase III subunit beta [Planomonospora sp. ID67723]MBG0830541.1 DNA polymerase III subunit beta [Planomonospora sp. ID67723]